MPEMSCVGNACRICYLGFVSVFFAIVIMVFTDFLMPKGAIYRLKWQEIYFPHSITRLEDVSTMRSPDNTLFPIQRNSCHSFTDINTNAKSDTHRLGRMQHPSHTRIKCSDLKMRRDKFYYSVLLFCDALVILFVHTAIPVSAETLFITARNFWEILALEHSLSLIFPSPLCHSSDDTQYSSADFFKKLFCVLEIVSMVTMIVIFVVCWGFLFCGFVYFLTTYWIVWK